MRRGMRIVRSVVAVAALTLVGGLLAAAPAQAVSTTIVINEVYGGGGNSGATYKQDFIELYNTSASSVDLNGWSVQYGSATGASWAVTPLTGTLPAGTHYVVKEAKGAGGSAEVPFDTTGTTAMSAPAGKVAVVNSTAALACGADCDSASAVVDFVGYGTTANDFAGTGPAPAPSNTTSITRDAAHTNTGNNATDFTTAEPSPTACGGACQPADSAPTVSSTTPADNAVGVAPGTNVSVTFSEPVDTTASAFTVSCASTGAHTVTVTGGPTTYTLNPDADFATGEVCTVTVVASEVTDQDTNDPPNAMAADYVFDFTTGAPVRIHDVQGAAHISPLTGQVVTLAPAIVTAKRSNGYYLQDPSPDTDDATSEGILVFTNSAPTVAVGDSVTVSGTVSEFRGGGTTAPGLTTTEITGTTATVNSSGNPLPTPIVLGIGGRAIPTDVIEDDATNVETSGAFDPAQDGIDFWESLEGMRVQVNNAVASGPTNSFGEVSVLADNGANASVRTTRGGIVVRPTDFNPERIILDDIFVATPVVNTGDHFSGPIVGIMDYAFNNPKLNVTTAVSRIADGVTRETTAAPSPGELAVATINVENLDPGDTPEKIAGLAAIIVNNMQSPDLMSVEEVQDNNGATNDGTVDASASYAALINAIAVAGGPTYQFRQINPVNNQDGGEPGGNIRVGFLFRTDRGLSFVDRPGGDSTTPVTVLSGPQLSISPGRVDPTNSAFNNSRKPLAGEFMFNDRPLFVVANHFNSKGGDQPLYGKNQPPTRTSEVQRHQQAQIVNSFVDAILAENADADVIVMGDINDFEFSTTMDILEGGTLTALMKTLPQSERYSYVFDGNSQSLDHIVVSPHLLALAAKTGFDAVHVNAEFADQASDHDPLVARFLLANAPPTVDAGGPYTVSEGGQATLTATGTDANGDELRYAWDLDNNGTYETAGQTVTYSAAGLDGPTTKTVRVQVSDPDGATGEDTATVNVVNVAPTITSVTAGSNAVCGAGTGFAVSFIDPGAGETFSATVNWGDGVIEQFTGVRSPFSPLHTYAKAGRHIASVTVGDDDGGVSAPAGAPLYVDYTVVGGGMQQPLNTVGELSVFRSGTVIAVRVQLRDCDGTFPATLAPSLDVVLVSHATPPIKVNEANVKPTPDVGSTMRFDPAQNVYVYNFPTKRLPDQTATYRFTITVPSTGQTITARFGVRM